MLFDFASAREKQVTREIIMFDSDGAKAHGHAAGAGRKKMPFDDLIIVLAGEYAIVSAACAAKTSRIDWRNAGMKWIDSSPSEIYYTLYCWREEPYI